MANEFLLKSMLELAVPLWQLELCELPAKRLQAMAAECCDIVCMADSLMGMAPGEKPGKCAADFNAVARGIAILSFVPGGVRVFGMHWQYGGPNGMNPEMPELLPPGFGQLLNRPAGG